MKNMQIIVISVCAACLLSSCSSTKTYDASAEQYGTETGSASPVAAPVSGADQNNAVQNQQITVPQQGNAVSRFFTGSTKDIEMNTAKLFQLTAVNTLKQEDASTIYNIKTQKTGFSAWYQTNWYHLLFDNVTRAGLSSASQQYLSDFEQKKLDRKNGKSYKSYGEYPVTIQWGTFPGMESGYADTDVQFGYEFKKDTPYFSITVWQTQNAAYTERSSDVQNSSTLHFYMTKAQVTQMAELLSDAKIAEALAPYMKRMEENTNPQTDKY
jgi:hypothetical protein